MKRLIFGLLIGLLLLGTAACGKEEPAVYYPNDSESGMLAPAMEESKGIFSFGDGSPAPVRVPTPTSIPRPAITVASSPGTAYDSSGSVPAERMVIRSAYLALVVEDVSASMIQITNLASAFGGFVVNSDIREEQNRLFANISFRVDSARFNEALQALRDLAADVRSESTSGQDVTEEYVDLGSSLRNLEASEAQLLELLKKAGKVDEILEVQRELVKTRGEIEQTKGRLQYLEQSSDLAYINASLEQSRLTVEFSANPRTVKEGQDIQFIPIIGGGFAPYSYEWDFGDGETSTEGAPVHAYRSDGTYTVALKIKDDKEHTADYERKDYITILPGWSAGNIANNAWKGLVSLGHVLASLFIGLAIFSPVWIVILVILYFVLWRKRKKKAP